MSQFFQPVSTSLLSHHVIQEVDGENGVGISFSKFKYRLQNMLTEIRVLKEKENSAKMDVESLIQKVRSAETDQEKMRASLQGQITESNDARQKLESTVKIMGLEVSVMEDKIKSSKMELKTVLESRNTLIEELKVSKYDLERKLKNATSQLAVAMDKLSRNSMLFEAVEVQASSVKRLLDETRQLVTSRSDSVLELQRQIDWMADAEQKLLDRARSLESELKQKNVSLCAKDKEIVALKEALETAKSDCGNQVKIASISELFLCRIALISFGKTLTSLRNIQRAAERKGDVISQLNLEKKELLRETERLKDVVRKFQESASQQDSALEKMRESLLQFQQTIKEKNEKTEETLSILEEKERLLNEHKKDIQRFQAEKEDWIHEKESLQFKYQDFKAKLDCCENKPSKIDVATVSSNLVEVRDQATSTHDLADEAIQIKNLEAIEISEELHSLDSQGSHENHSLSRPDEPTSVLDVECTKTVRHDKEENKLDGIAQTSPACQMELQRTNDQSSIAESSYVVIPSEPSEQENQNTSAVASMSLLEEQASIYTLEPSETAPKELGNVNEHGKVEISADVNEIQIHNVEPTKFQCHSDAEVPEYGIQSRHEEPVEVSAYDIEIRHDEPVGNAAYEIQSFHEESVMQSHSEKDAVGERTALPAPGSYFNSSLETSPECFRTESSCICSHPPYGYMIKCVNCENQFHATCISWESLSSEYVCASCKDQPAKKRRRVATRGVTSLRNSKSL